MALSTEFVPLNSFERQLSARLVPQVHFLLWMPRAS